MGLPHYGINNVFRLENIERYDGLRSKEFLEQNKSLDNITCGGNNLSHRLDKNLGNWDKISLNFTPHTPMAYIKKSEMHLVFIELDIEIATVENVLFTNCNATRTRNGQMREIGLNGLNNVQFSHIKTNPKPKPWDEDWHKYVQAEVLVPDCIPIDYFKAIHVVSQTSKKTAEYFLDANKNLLVIKPTTFQDQNTLKFSFVKNYYVSLTEINGNNAETIDASSPYIKMGEPFWVLVYFFADVGTDWKIVFNGDNYYIEEYTNINKQSYWYWYTEFKAPGTNQHVDIEIYCNDILWAKDSIEVRA